MSHWIEKVVEPERLILAWQAADPDGPRFRWSVGEIARAEQSYRFRYFTEGAEFTALNDGKTFAEIRTLGFAGYPAFALGTTPFEQDVMKAFRRRLPSRERSDYADYLRHFRLTPDVPVSDFALLGLTGAKLPSDGFQVIDPLEDTRPARDLFLEVAGYRHYVESAPVPEGAAVSFKPEPHNPHDGNAVSITVGGRVIGYVDRLRTAAFKFWFEEGRLTGFVERLNGRPDHPRAYVFVHVAERVIRAAA